LRILVCFTWWNKCFVLIFHVKFHEVEKRKKKHHNKQGGPCCYHRAPLVFFFRVFMLKKFLFVFFLRHF
jgi:hypothetical protein